MQRISVEELFVIAEHVLGQPAEEVLSRSSIERAERALSAPFASYEGLELYPQLADKVAVLIACLVGWRPLHDGNRRAALVCARLLVERNGARWTPSLNGDDEIAETIEQLLAGRLSQRELAAWLHERIVRA